MIEFDCIFSVLGSENVHSLWPRIMKIVLFLWQFIGQFFFVFCDAESVSEQMRNLISISSHKIDNLSFSISYR